MPTEPTGNSPNNLVPGDGAQPSNAPTDEMVRSEPLGDDEEHHDQINWAGERNIDGSGEFPDPDTPPDLDAGAPGPEVVGHREHGHGQFAEVLPHVGAGPEGAQRHDAPD